MNWAWAGSLDHLWRSPGVPMWLTLAAAGLFGFVVLITLMRAEKSVANGALTVITLLSVGLAAAVVVGGDRADGQSQTAENRSAAMAVAGLPTLSCLDELAGDVVLAACEKAVFGSPETVAAAVSYAASQITRLSALGEVTANNNITPELQALRRAVEHDRYGLVAQVLVARNKCTPADCPAFGVLSDRQQIVANMEAHLYESLVTRYSPSWNAPIALASVPSGPSAALPVSLPTGRPTNAEFPTAASTPAVSIMNPEPGTGSTAASGTGATPPRAATAATPAASPKPPAASAQASATPPAKKPAPKPPRTSSAAPPVQITPAQAQPTATANE